MWHDQSRPIRLRWGGDVTTCETSDRVCNLNRRSSLKWRGVHGKIGFTGFSSWFLLILFFQFWEILPHFDLQFLRKIKVKFDDFLFFQIVLNFSFIKYNFPQFLSSIHRQIWSNLKRSSEISLLPYGFDPYLLLYPSIRVIFIKLVSLDFILTRIGVELLTTSIRSVSYPRQLETQRSHGSGLGGSLD